MKLNTAPDAPPRPVTHEGGPAAAQSSSAELQRTVATCLLWEDTFYEKGSDIAARLSALVRACTFAEVADVAKRARDEWKLRHVPLFLCAEMAAKRAEHPGPIVGIGIIGDTMAHVIQRPDELAEFLAIYWRDGKRPLSKQVKRGLAMAFNKFSQYQLSKWDREGKVRLRDVLFLSHAKPKDTEQDALWKLLVAKTLPPADTWEVALSGGADKKEAFTRLLLEDKLGIMAMLMNLRNMVGAGVDLALIADCLKRKAPGSKALPFRFITAARYAPALAGDLSDALLLAIGDDRDWSGATPRILSGETHIVVDVSGSMDATLSGKGETNRIDAASGLAIMCREWCERVRVFTFSDNLVEVASHRGLPLRDAIMDSQRHNGTYLSKAIMALPGGASRVIVVTDEQSHDGGPPTLLNTKCYLINVAPYKPGLDTTGGWMRVNGWSERIIDWILLDEQMRDMAA